MASMLGLISYMRLDGRQNIQSVKSAQSVPLAGLKAHIPPPLQGNNTGCKQTHAKNTINIAENNKLSLACFDLSRAP